LALGFSTVPRLAPSSTGVTVKFADLDVASRTGVLVLCERIRSAAQGACSFYCFKTDADEFRCVHNAIANAVTKVNQHALSAVYDAKYKTPGASALVSRSR
jgi:UrcA family protein